ncbi:MAG TPA: SUMF1/EgtB/PvdO family nonheme iron enzyme [Blastocatellia bacterium]|nr:SUMF1/EgtB/PvdO family nonheme iron enzyme [Blastocatellia bacterium]
MSNPASPDGKLLMFEDFLEYLRHQGFTVGVDHYLRLQHLLNKLSDSCAPSDLKTLLCPILATNKAEQEQFYHTFDTYFEVFRSPVLEINPGGTAEENLPIITLEPKPVTGHKWPYALAGTLVMILILILFETINVPQSKIRQVTGKNSNQPVIADVTPGDKPPSEVATTIRQENDTFTPTPDPQLSFYERYGDLIRIGAILAPLLFFLFYEWYRFNRRKLILQKQHGKKPPYVWPLKVEAPVFKLYDSEQFYSAARRMRRRQIGEYQRLDVDATVTATIDSLGYPRFLYKADSKYPEYLVLIDRASFRDHLAQLFNQLAKALEAESVFVSRYFYDGDPRVCRNEAGDSIHLEDLHDKHAGQRLLIFGNGHKIISPITGELGVWATTFLNWKDRALLTPESPSEWGLREITLAGQFFLLPATLDALPKVIDYFESIAIEDLRSWRENCSDALPRHFDKPELIEALRGYLGEETFQWLCACAVYPELHWDLTFYLGSLECMKAGQVKEETLLRLIRLPWFRSGAIPDDLRWSLIRELDRDKETVIRAAIIKLLEKNPPPKESVAADAYRLNLVVQRWVLRRDRKRRREMLQAMKSQPQSHVSGDYTLLRFLESASFSPLNMILPRRLRKAFYRDGIPAFGLKTSARLVVTLIAIVMAWIFIKSPLPPGQATNVKKNSTSISELSVVIPPGMIYIPGGKFTMGFDGSDEPSEKPEHVETMNAFFIDKTEVTVGDYYKFIKAKNHRPPDSWSQAWKNGTFRASEERLPVAGVSWLDAKEYAEWAGKRLPTEKEWEYAARGTDKRLYPWGNDFDAARANVADSQENGPVTVGGYATGKSPYGALDMAGNVAEWTDSDSFRYPGSQTTPKPGKIVRGGSFRASKIYAMTTTRTAVLGDRTLPDVGFRCAKDISVFGPIEGPMKF